MSENTTVQRVNEAYLALMAVRQEEAKLFAALVDEMQFMARENLVLRSVQCPENEEWVSSPQAMILRVVADLYGSRDRTDGDTELGQEWASHMSAIDAIIERLDLGDTIRSEDLLELQWWYNAVILSSRVLPNVVTSAFLDIMNELAARWGWPPTGPPMMPSPANSRCPSDEELAALPGVERVVHINQGDVPMFRCGDEVHMIAGMGGVETFKSGGDMCLVPTMKFAPDADVLEAIQVAMQPLTRKGKVTIVIRDGDQFPEFGFVTSRTLVRVRPKPGSPKYKTEYEEVE